MPMRKILNRINPSHRQQFESGCPYQVNMKNFHERFCVATEQICVYQNTAYSWVERYLCYSIAKQEFISDQPLTTSEIQKREKSVPLPDLDDHLN